MGRRGKRGRVGIKIGGRDDKGGKEWKTRPLWLLSKKRFVT